jgi:trans-2,3-dihydro-3-hydroxyanthranilate isomerase
MPRRFYTLDVFTDTKLAGNPLAVVLDSEGLDAGSMQRIAREFNLSETVFCAPPRDPVNTASLRIFTPATELPFAGHPTVGAAILLATLQASDLLAREDVGLVLEEPIGAVTCTARHRRGEAAHARFDVPVLAKEAGDAAGIEDLADVLGLSASDIGFANHRPRRFSVGNTMTFVPIASLEALGRARLKTDGQPTMFYLYTPADSGNTPTFRSRMFSSGFGVTEDPATGSAAAALPAVLHIDRPFADGEHDCILLQGVEMGRPSRIGLAFTVEGGCIATTAIGGSAILVAQGTIDV